MTDLTQKQKALLRDLKGDATALLDQNGLIKQLTKRALESALFGEERAYVPRAAGARFRFRATDPSIAGRFLMGQCYPDIIFAELIAGSRVWVLLMGRRVCGLTSRNNGTPLGVVPDTS